MQYARSLFRSEGISDIENECGKFAWFLSHRLLELKLRQNKKTVKDVKGAVIATLFPGQSRGNANTPGGRRGCEVGDIVYTRPGECFALLSVMWNA